MKYLLILTLFLTGCFKSNLTTQNPKELLFRAGQDVITTETFYSGCEGKIVDYNRIKQIDEPPHYYVDFYCGKYRNLIANVLMSEENLFPN